MNTKSIRFLAMILIVHFKCSIIIAQTINPLELADYSNIQVEVTNLYTQFHDVNIKYGEYIALNTGSSETFSLLANKTENNLFITPSATKKISLYIIPPTVYDKTRINKFAFQNTGYEGKTKIWKPFPEDIIAGSITTLLGLAAMLIPPFPDFSTEAKMGPQMLFLFGSSTTAVGLGFTFSGIFHRAKINHPTKYPESSKSQMKLLPTSENGRITALITGILNQGQIKVHDMTKKLNNIPKNASAFDDRIEFMIKNQKSEIYFNNLYTYGVTTISGFPKIFVIGSTEFKITKNQNQALFRNLENDFDLIRKQLFNELKAQGYAEQLEAFKPLATKYLGLRVKPAMSAEQRNYIVQANSSLEAKKFDNAITFFNKAISVDPIAYPTAYFNLAIALALAEKYEDAILNMNKYLLLVPDSTEAHDKIYEWELKIKK